MKCSLNWLKRHINFIEFANIEVFIQEIEKVVIAVGMELESVKFINPILQVKVKEVTSIEGLELKNAL